MNAEPSLPSLASLAATASVAPVAPAPYVPPAFLPGMARLVSALVSRAALKDGVFRFSFDPLAREPSSSASSASSVSPAFPVSAFLLEAGGFLFRLEFPVLDFLASQDILKGVDVERLPEGVRLAAIEMALRPFQDALEKALKITLMPLPAENAPSGWLEPSLRFSLDFQGRTIPLVLKIASEEGADWLASRVLAALPERWRNPERGNWPLEAALLAGWMRVPLALLDGLAVSDILLPPDYPAKRGELFLETGGHGVFRLSVSGHQAAVVECIDHFFEENAMPEEKNPEARENREARVDRAALEAVVRFELEKKLLPLSEIESLSPGKTFALGTDPLSAVTVILNGQALASGRLVDLGGTLGVQITRLAGKPHG